MNVSFSCLFSFSSYFAFYVLKQEDHSPEELRVQEGWRVFGSSFTSSPVLSCFFPPADSTDPVIKRVTIITVSNMFASFMLSIVWRMMGLQEFVDLIHEKAMQKDFSVAIPWLSNLFSIHSQTI